jgi:hypothetical protein
VPDLVRLDVVMAGRPAEHAAVAGFPACVFGRWWVVRAVLDRTVVVWTPADDVPRELHRFDEVFVDPACVRFVPERRPDAASRANGLMKSRGLAGRKRMREATGG